jgi:hypothetical protein
MNRKMKQLIINLSLLVGVVLLSVFCLMMSELNIVSREINPPEKTIKHIQLEQKQFLTDSEYAELRKEEHDFENRWQQKAENTEWPITKSLNQVKNRLQLPLLLIIAVFFILIKVNAFKDWLSFLVGLSLVTFILPILSLQTYMFGLCFSGAVVYIKVRKLKSNP